MKKMFAKLRSKVRKTVTSIKMALFSICMTSCPRGKF